MGLKMLSSRAMESRKAWFSTFGAQWRNLGMFRQEKKCLREAKNFFEIAEGLPYSSGIQLILNVPIGQESNQGPTSGRRQVCGEHHEDFSSFLEIEKPRGAWVA